MSEPVCYCGHVGDEHDWRGECQVEGCECLYFERNPEIGADSSEPDAAGEPAP